MPPKKTSERKFKKKTVPEDFELSDDEPTTIKLDEELRLSSKSITFDCPNCFTKWQLWNEKQVNTKGAKISCNPCSFKISQSDKTVNVSRDENGDITLESEDHSISFSWNRQIAPEDHKAESANIMISDVINTPRNSAKRIDDID